jgi:hypothetical protein
MFRATLLFASAYLCLLPASYAQVGTRKALIVGNSQYVADDKNNAVQFSPLEPMPTNDVNEMYDALVRGGFDPREITRKYNLNQAEFATALNDFSQRLQPDDKALLYFSGHGFSIGAENYLVPIGFRFGTTRETVAKDAVSISSVLNHLRAANTRVLILDACRDEPAFFARLPKGLTDSAPIRNLVEQNSYGTLIAFAAGAGERADASPVNGMSPYTSVLVSVLAEGPPNIEQAILTTKTRVYLNSGRHQNPAFYDNLQGDFALKSTILEPPVDPSLSAEAAYRRGQEAWVPTRPGAQPDYVAALNFFEFAAARGSGLSTANVGWIYENGLGLTAADCGQAMQWYQKALASGYTKASWNIGRLYDLGCGVPQDYKAARYWYEIAKAQNVPEATRDLKKLDDEQH